MKPDGLSVMVFYKIGMKTGADGKYKFYTLKPAPYPGGHSPAHIHAIEKEPGCSAYYVDEIYLRTSRL